MTSANFFNGYTVDKPSSKVVNPPGGRSNNIFGYADEEPKPVQSSKQESNQTRNASTIFNEPTSNAQSRKRCGYNPITGQSYDAEVPKPVERKPEPTPVETKAEPANNHAESKPNDASYHPRAIHTSSKVLQPPGGASTKLW